jgi:hypothetical protein
MSARAIPATNLGVAEATNAEITPTGKFVVWAAILSILFFSQIAYNVGDFPASTDLFCYATFALYLLTSGHASLHVPALILFLTATAFACLGMTFAAYAVSWTSLLLLLALYLPFAVRLKAAPDLAAIHQYIQFAYVSAATVIACIAVAQIVLVNVFGASYLANVYFILPDGIRGAGTYTFLREEAGIVKANGFFLRESADLSIMTALAIIIEYFTRARWRVLAILAAGMLSSFSGSGILALVVGFLIPRSLNRVPLFVLSAIVVIPVFFLMYNSDIPGLTLFFDRLSEFNTPGTSGYARFVAPLEMVQTDLDKGGTAMWLGNGAGSFLRSTSLLRLRYEVNDPTWAKLIYEYGLVGFTLILALFSVRLYSSALRPEICNFILFAWLSTGLVLKPYFALVVWLLTLVPQAYHRRVQDG